MERSLIITQGDEKAYNLSFFIDRARKQPLDISGATVTMTAKRTRNDTEAAFPPRVVTSHTAPIEGKTTITLSHEDTSISLGNYYYDIQISGGSIPKKTVMKGKLEITWQVTEG